MVLRQRYRMLWMMRRDRVAGEHFTYTHNNSRSDTVARLYRIHPGSLEGAKRMSRLPDKSECLQVFRNNWTDNGQPWSEHAARMFEEWWKGSEFQARVETQALTQYRHNPNPIITVDQKPADNSETESTCTCAMFQQKKTCWHTGYYSREERLTRGRPTVGKI